MHQKCDRRPISNVCILSDSKEGVCLVRMAPLDLITLLLAFFNSWYSAFVGSAFRFLKIIRMELWNRREVCSNWCNFRCNKFTYCPCTIIVYNTLLFIIQTVSTFLNLLQSYLLHSAWQITCQSLFQYFPDYCLSLLNILNQHSHYKTSLSHTHTRAHTHTHTHMYTHMYTHTHTRTHTRTHTHATARQMIWKLYIESQQFQCIFSVKT